MLHGRHALVTGAGSGIGAACARLLAARGHDVVLVGRTHAKLEAVRGTLPDPTRHLAIEADLADVEAAHAAVDRTLEAYGRIDALVLVAGVAPFVPIEATTEEILEEAFFNNTFAPAYLIVRAWPHLKSRRAGRIAIVSTIGSTDPFPGFFAYAASKAATDSFARSIAREGKSIGVRGFAINPGAVETPLLRKNFPERVIPRERALPPEAVAEVVVACACGERDADNGRAIPVPS